MAYRIGVDLGGTNIAVGLVDESYQIKTSISAPTCADRPAEEVVSNICRTIDTMLLEYGISMEDCMSIGIGAPGCCDVQKGVVSRSYSLSWKDVPLAALVGKRYPIPVKVDNDANCAALAEVKAGAAQGCNSMVLVTLGTGIGTGVVFNGCIYPGFKGVVEMGHTLLEMDGELCFCGRKGCWDAYASATALIIQAKRAAAGRPESLLNHMPEINGKSVFEAAEKETLLLTR